MDDADRYRLLHGPYGTPPFRYGDDAFCERFGDCVLVGLHDAPISWPVGKRRGKGQRGRFIVLTGALIEAVRCESEQAVAHWWGVSLPTVWLWRKALGVPATNEGTRRLRHDYALEPAITAARQKAHAKVGDPARRKKIAASKRGRPRPRHVVEAVAAAHRGKAAGEQTRARMSAAHRKRRTRPPKAGRPWTDAEDELVRTRPPKEVAARTGRTVAAVYVRRQVLGVPDGRAGRKIATRRQQA
jgi:hypothetical protein